MAYRSRSFIASITAFLVGCAVFIHDALHDIAAYVGHSIFGLDILIDHRTRLHVDSMERELRADTLELTPLGERFKAFIARRLDHARALGDGFLSGEAGWLPAH